MNRRLFSSLAIVILLWYYNYIKTSSYPNHHEADCYETKRTVVSICKEEIQSGAGIFVDAIS